MWLTIGDHSLFDWITGYWSDRTVGHLLIDVLVRYWWHYLRWLLIQLWLLLDDLIKPSVGLFS